MSDAGEVLGTAFAAEKELERVSREREEFRGMYEGTVKERDLAEARAERLAGELRKTAEWLRCQEPGGKLVAEQIDKVLARKED